MTALCITLFVKILGDFLEKIVEFNIQPPYQS
jgi:hypothetical protein